MNSIYRLMGAAAVCVAASLSLSASAETPAGDTAGAAASSQAPIPTLHCEFKAMSACAQRGHRGFRHQSAGEGHRRFREQRRLGGR